MPHDSARRSQPPASRNSRTTDTARMSRRVLDRSPHRQHPDSNCEEPKLFEAPIPATSTSAPASRSKRDGDDLWRCACRVPLAGRRTVCRNRSDCPLTPPRRGSRGSRYAPSEPDEQRDTATAPSECHTADRKRSADGHGFRQFRQHRATTRTAASSRWFSSTTSRQGDPMPPTAPTTEAARGYQKHIDKPGSPPLRVTQPDKLRHRKVRLIPTSPKRRRHDRLPAGNKDAFPRFGTFRRNQIRRSLRVGLPHQRRPPSGFLTLSTV